MRRPLRRLRHGLLGLMASMLAIGCAHYEPLTPLGETVQVETLDPDEQHLWKESRRIQHEIESSGLAFEDPELDDYLARVLDRVGTSELDVAGLEPRVVVISDVQMHAYSFSNGVIYVHTGLLARMQDETQLATMLSRELAHVIHRHSLRAHRDRRAQADAMAWVGVGATLVEGGSDAKLLLQAASISSQAGFHHVLETQADAKGLATLHEAGYDVHEAPRFFESTIDYQREIHAQGPWSGFAFVPPVHVRARIDGYDALIAREYGDAKATRPPIADDESFRRKMHGVRLHQANLELAAGLPESAEKTARLAARSDPSDAEAWVLVGRAHDHRRKKAHPGRAIPATAEIRQAFERALDVDRQNPTAIREIGMTYYRAGGSRAPDPESASQALRYLRRYLSIVPDAEDASYVRSYIRRLTGSEASE